MTSRNSFSNLMKEDIKQRLWNVILAGIMVILPITVALAMRIGDYRLDFEINAGQIDEEQVRAQFMGFFDGSNIWMHFMTVISAILCAASGFEYGFSKRKTDFFHSLPIKREKLFFVRYLNGVLIYIVPYVLMLLISALMLGTKGWMSGELALTMLVGMLYHFLGFLIMYAVAILATQLAGRPITWIGMFGWLNLYVPLVIITIFNMMDTQYYTFCATDIEEILLKFRGLTPMLYYCLWMPENGGMIENFGGGVGYFFGYWMVTLLYALVLTAIALLAHKKRSSEGAEKPICFSFMKPVLLISVTVIAGILGGVFLMSLVDFNRDTGWGVVGCLIGGVLCHMLLESIFHSDVKKCFAQWKIMIGCLVLSCTVVVGIRIDPFHYDEYMPKKESLAEIDIDCGNMFLPYGYIKIGDLDAGYAFAEYAKEHRLNKRDLDDNLISYELGISYIAVAYKKKSGRTIYREYEIVMGDIIDRFGPVYESEGYREKAIAMKYRVDNRKVTGIVGVYGDSEVTFTLSEEEKKELVRLAKQELAEVSWHELTRTSQVGSVEIFYREQPSDYEVSLPVYASCTKTLEFMRNHGLVTPYAYNPGRIESVKLHAYWDQGLMDVVVSAFEEQLVTGKLTEEEKENLRMIMYDGLAISIKDFEQLRPALVPYSLANDFGSFSDCWSGYVEVMVAEDDYGNVSRYLYRVRKGTDIRFLLPKLYEW